MRVKGNRSKVWLSVVQEGDSCMLKSVWTKPDLGEHLWSSGVNLGFPCYVVISQALKNSNLFKYRTVSSKKKLNALHYEFAIVFFQEKKSAYIKPYADCFSALFIVK